METALLSNLALSLAMQPVMLVWLVGIVWALLSLRKAKGPALVALVTLALFLVVRLADTFLSSYWLPMLQLKQGWSAATYGAILTTRGWIVGIITAVLWVGVLLAIFGWRRGAAGR